MTQKKDPENEITALQLINISQLLSNVMADEMVVYIKPRKIHKKICGKNYMQLHKMYENQYKNLEETVEKISISMLTLESLVNQTNHDQTEFYYMQESINKFPEEKLKLFNLIKTHETDILKVRNYIEGNRDAIQDDETTECLLAIIEEHETFAWALKRFIN